MLNAFRQRATAPTYTYGNSNWKDQLTNLNGTTISYDNVGNPLNFVSNGYNWDLTWNGRQLTSMSEDMDGQSLSFTYNDSGIRTSKVVDGVVHTYTLNGSQIISEEWSNKLIIYLYDESGSPIGFAYRTTSMAANTFYYYFYEKNLQGDIVAIYNTAGTKLVSYTYDAWGKVTMTTHTSLTGTNAGAMYNPFRYRGYYYDTETGLYYLNSRYYDPDTGRFINADGYINANGDLIGFNMYAYCSNNPVMGYDPNGEAFLTTAIVTAFLTSFAISLITSSISEVVEDVVEGNEIKVNIGEVILYATLDGLSSALAVAFPTWAMVSYAGFSAFGEALNSWYFDSKSVGEGIVAIVSSASFSMIGGSWGDSKILNQFDDAVGGWIEVTRPMLKKDAWKELGKVTQKLVKSTLGDLGQTLGLDRINELVTDVVNAYIWGTQ